MKTCTKCKEVKSLLLFGKEARTGDGLREQCKVCRKAYRKLHPNVDKRKHRPRPRASFHTARYLATKAQRTPKWLTAINFDQINMFYEAATSLTKELGIKMEVDHIIPLFGENVSGLHVPWNLQVLTKSDNARKGNRCA
jgi:5-methylcytosine-specific restriction endonuclease McrA